MGQQVYRELVWDMSNPQRQSAVLPIISIAPMLDLTDRHFRYMMRLITKQTLVYSEMITTQAILRGDRKRLLYFNPVEKPLALQLGGKNPGHLAECTKIAEDLGYDEINLNVGCPSDKVQSGSFGACLMAQPELVAECVGSMKAVTKLPVTVKHRIGINGLENYENLVSFVNTVAASQCDRYIVHARIAILNGLGPKQNRTIPPLRYSDVYDLKKEFPGQIIEINGGIQNFDQAQSHLSYVDGVMLGRSAYENPSMFADADRLFFNEIMKPSNRRHIILSMLPYYEMMLLEGHKLRYISRHLLEIMNGQPKAKIWRRFITEGLLKDPDNFSLFEKSLDILPDNVLDETS